MHAPMISRIFYATVRYMSNYCSVPSKKATCATTDGSHFPMTDFLITARYRMHPFPSTAGRPGCLHACSQAIGTQRWQLRSAVFSTESIGDP